MFTSPMGRITVSAAFRGISPPEARAEALVIAGPGRDDEESIHDDSVNLPTNLMDIPH